MNRSSIFLRYQKESDLFNCKKPCRLRRRFEKTILHFCVALLMFKPLSLQEGVVLILTLSLFTEKSPNPQVSLFLRKIICTTQKIIQNTGLIEENALAPMLITDILIFFSLLLPAIIIPAFILNALCMAIVALCAIFHTAICMLNSTIVVAYIALANVIFGDVWVCSGQSNMAYSNGSYEKPAPTGPYKSLGARPLSKENWMGSCR